MKELPALINCGDLQVIPSRTTLLMVLELEYFPHLKKTIDLWHMDEFVGKVNPKSAECSCTMFESRLT